MRWCGGARQWCAGERRCGAVIQSQSWRDVEEDIAVDDDVDADAPGAAAIDDDDFGGWSCIGAVCRRGVRGVVVGETTRSDEASGWTPGDDAGTRRDDDDDDDDDGGGGGREGR